MLKVYNTSKRDLIFFSFFQVPDYAQCSSPNADEVTLLYNGSKQYLKLSNKFPPSTMDALKTRIRDTLILHPDVPLDLTIHDHLSCKFLPLPQSFLKHLAGAELMVHISPDPQVTGWTERYLYSYCT